MRCGRRQQFDQIVGRDPKRGLPALDLKRRAGHVEILLEGVVDAAGIGLRHIQHTKARLIAQRQAIGAHPAQPFSRRCSRTARHSSPATARRRDVQVPAQPGVKSYKCRHWPRCPTTPRPGEPIYPSKRLRFAAEEFARCFERPRMRGHKHQRAVARRDPVLLVKALGNQKAQMSAAPRPRIGGRRADNARHQARYSSAHSVRLSAIAGVHNSRHAP